MDATKTLCRYAPEPIDVKERKYNPVAEAYNILLKAMNDPCKDGAYIAIEEALGYLGEALAE